MNRKPSTEQEQIDRLSLRLGEIALSHPAEEAHLLLLQACAGASAEIIACAALTTIQHLGQAVQHLTTEEET